MKSIYPSFVLLLSATLLAQSNIIVGAEQAQKAMMPLGGRNGQPLTRKESVVRHNTVPQASGLSFAPAVIYA